MTFVKITEYLKFAKAHITIKYFPLKALFYVTLDLANSLELSFAIVKPHPDK